MARAFWLTLFFALFTISRCAACKLDQCVRIYNMKMEEENIPEPEASPAYCNVLAAYGHCVHATTRSCRGNLKFHTTFSSLNPLKIRYNCTKHSGGGTHFRPHSTAAPPPPPPPQCSFHGRQRFRHCGLFGDPHLKTFDNQYQTCRVKGAWPLIDNAYLAVQVTNEQVVEGSPATAPTKVTIIIKGRSTPCTSEKTYEAVADAPLPTTFIDGSYRSGPDESVVIAASNGASERVEIFLRYVDTTLVVRRVGKHLAFSAKLPEELVENSLQQDPESLQLCTRGCPVTERLDLVTSRGHQVSWETALEKCRSTEDLSNDIVNNLTDYYLDWCVFDAMTAGVEFDFTAAAHSAQADVLRLDPSSLQNRTSLLLSQAPPSAASLQRVSAVLLLLMILLRQFL
ncbi:repulsive guidance molecule A-like [Macrosteles quadrilineatus]|uniref:repulsive guidance molecule A-like n=1 Tax=Macrosteles quadrilineatus TaxID=74068 RepID=UPI0023E0D651|nr:repulsive guidance molecule A-like [Macrosteles quadrilineatus]